MSDLRTFVQASARLLTAKIGAPCVVDVPPASPSWLSGTLGGTLARFVATPTGAVRVLGPRRLF